MFASVNNTGRKIAQIGQTEPKGSPKAYKGTPRGEVCSKHKATKKKKFEHFEFLP